MTRLGALLLAGFLGLSPAQAAETAVDLELVLAVDISGSIDADEALLQRQGYVAALTDPELMDAIKSGITGRVAMTYVEWAGPQYKKVVVDWTVIGSEAHAQHFARQLLSAPIMTSFWTSITSVLDYARGLFDGNNISGTRRAIDVSGDGANNQGGLVTDARDRAVAAGLTVNGLAIMNGRPSRYGRPPIPNLDWYYADCVIGGTGAFLIVANGHQDFARAIRRKLILEIAGDDPRRVVEESGEPRLMLASQLEPRVPCTAGEMRMHELMQDDW